MEGKTKVKLFGALATAGALVFGATSEDVKKKVSSGMSFLNNIAISTSKDNSQERKYSGLKADNGGAININEDNDINIVDVTGHLIDKRHLDFKSGQFQIDVLHLSSGAYFIEVIDNSGNRKVAKFIKE